MKTFDDLEFEKIESTFLENNTLKNGVRARLMFDNNFGISVIKTCISYGHQQGLFEIAVLDSKEEVTYKTPITKDVIGHLTAEKVSFYMLKIQKLKTINYKNDEYLYNMSPTIIDIFTNQNNVLLKELIEKGYVIYDNLNDSFKFSKHSIK